MTSRWPWLSRYDPAICDRCGRTREWHCENCGSCGPADGCQVCAGRAGDVVVDADDCFDVEDDAQTNESLPQER